MSKFKCPECGSYMFGSSQNTDGTLTRHCHGNEKWKCNFSFNEKDDHLYFEEDQQGYLKYSPLATTNLPMDEIRQ